MKPHFKAFLDFYAHQILNELDGEIEKHTAGSHLDHLKEEVGQPSSLRKRFYDILSEFTGF